MVNSARFGRGKGNKGTTIIRAGVPYCPLCDKKMREIITSKGTFYVCAEAFCMVSINVKDPMVGKWRENEDTHPPCPLCGKPMRMFWRSDGCYKQQCRDKSHNQFQFARWPAEEMPALEDTH